MPFYIAGAILLSSAYTANEARKSRQEAEREQRTMLAQQASDQAAMRLELSKQTAEYAKQGASLEQQANIAREQFATSQQNYQTNKLEMERKAKEVQAAADEELDFVRPEFFPENFWDEESGPDVEGLAKAYSELRAKMSAGKHKAPKDGKYEITSLKDRGVAEDDPMLKDFVGLAKEQGLSQEQFDQMIDLYTNHMGAADEQMKTSREAEMKKLGRNADKIVQSTEQWLVKMQNAGTLNQSEIEAIGRASNNASFISALHKIRASYMETDIPGLEMQESQTRPRVDS